LLKVFNINFNEIWLDELFLRVGRTVMTKLQVSFRCF